MDLLNQLKVSFPTIQFTKGNLDKPTPQYVMGFYSEFIKKMQGFIHFVLGWYVDDLMMDVAPAEEGIYVQMMKLKQFFEPLQINFLLSDINAPCPKRTKLIFKICLYIINHMDEYSGPLEKITTDIMNMKRNSTELFSDNEKLTYEINDFVVHKVDLLKENKVLKEEVKKAIEQKKVLSKLSTSQNELEKNTKLEALRRKIEAMKLSVNKLENEEKQLVKVEEEFLKTQNSIPLLQMEIKSLEIDYMDHDEIFEQSHKLIKHYEECIKLFPDYFTDLRNTWSVRKAEVEDLIHKHKNICSKYSSQKKNYDHLMCTLDECNQVFTQSESKNNFTKKTIQKSRDLLLKQLTENKVKLEDTLKHKLCEKENLEKSISVYKNDFEILKEHFKKEYIRVSNVKSDAFNLFNELIKDM